MEIVPPIATKANEDSCTNCHSLTGSMEAKCAACHNTEAFAATVIKAHVAAGIGCVSCHSEHQGSEFSPAHAALANCTACHNDANTGSTTDGESALRMAAHSAILWSMKNGRGRDWTTTTGR